MKTLWLYQGTLIAAWPPQWGFLVWHVVVSLYWAMVHFKPCQRKSQLRYLLSLQMYYIDNIDSSPASSMNFLNLASHSAVVMSNVSIEATSKEEPLPHQSRNQLPRSVRSHLNWLFIDEASIHPLLNTCTVTDCTMYLYQRIWATWYQSGLAPLQSHMSCHPCSVSPVKIAKRVGFWSGYQRHALQGERKNLIWFHLFRSFWASSVPAFPYTQRVLLLAGSWLSMCVCVCVACVFPLWLGCL